MSIIRIEMTNCKSINKLDLIISKNLNCFVGQNNVGKTNILKTLDFFYKSLTAEKFDPEMFNQTNPYSQELRINITYDYGILMEKIKLAGYDLIFGNFLGEENELFEKIAKYKEKYCDQNNQVTLSLTMNKNGEIDWNIKDYYFRLFMATRFPVFFLETRKINLYDWDSLWDILGLIAPFRHKIQVENLDGIFEETANENNYSQVIEGIREIFEENDVILNKSTVFNKISQIIQLQLGGNSFDHQTHSLNTGSSGMNSYTYMKIYVSFILRLVGAKYLSSPVVLIDEPELHLHPKRIEGFVKYIREDNNFWDIKWVFTTHSPTFTKNIIVRNESYDMFHVTNTSYFNKTYVTKINGFTEQKKYKLLSDREANLYFSSSCLFVEGDTEFELFSINKLGLIYPGLEGIDVYSYNSSYDRLKLVNPRDKKTKINYLVLLDMDKVLSYSNKKNKFKLAGSSYLNILKDEKLKNREKFHYTYKLKRTFFLRKSIEDMVKNTTFTVDDSGMCLNEQAQYALLNNNLKMYFLEYNLFPVRTTAEGLLINESNYNEFYSWLIERIGLNIELDQIFNSLNNSQQKTSLLRILFSGKSEWLHNEKNLNEQNVFFQTNKTIKSIRSNINQNFDQISNKTSGWVTNFIIWFIDKHLNIDDQTKYKENRNTFSHFFPELGEILECLDNM